MRSSCGCGARSNKASPHDGGEAAAEPMPGSAGAGAEAPRVLMLGYGWFPDRLGGLNRYYRDLLEHLPEASGVVVGRAASMPARVAGVADHGRPTPVRLLAVWRAAQRAANFSDAVDAHFALYSLAAVRFGRARTMPLIVHFHGPWADESEAAGDRSRIRRRARRSLERAVYRRADQAVVLTSAFRQVLVERYRLQPWAINVVPPGVDLVRFSLGSTQEARAELGIADTAFVAVTVRRLVPRMGVQTLVEAWSQAVADLPAGSTLVIAGEGPMASEIAQASARAGASVRLLGRVSDEQLVSLYRAADIAVVPSLEHEGFGLVVTEAAACGTPSIVTSVGGLPEAIAGLDPSLIVSPGDSAELRDRLLASRTARPGRAVTRAFAEKFDWDDVAERHRKIAQQAIAGHTPNLKSRVMVRGNERLRVVYVDHVAQLSGGEIALLRLLPHLDRVDAHVILAEDGPLVGQLHLAGISTEVLPLAEHARNLRKGAVHRSGVSPSVAGATAAYTLRLARRLRQLRPDLVHANSLKAGLYGSLAARIAGIPLIWHVRDRIAEDYLPAPAVALIRYMTRRFATAVVANSRSTLETLAARSHPIVIYSVLPEVLSDVPVRDRTTREALTFGVVGRLAPWKGQDFFLRAFAEAFAHGDEQAVIVGGALFGERDYADQLPPLADRLLIGERVELRGHRLDVWDELSRIDVLVHASVTPEPFGQVVLEGMAAGVPVVAARAGGPAEMVEHNVTGVLYTPNDTTDLAAAMTAMRDPQLRERLSAAARDRLAPYAPSTVAAQLETLYATVVARHERV
jgi:glycosyltransferase involved in cell wall biosynthesis